MDTVSVSVLVVMVAVIDSVIVCYCISNRFCDGLCNGGSFCKCVG